MSVRWADNESITAVRITDTPRHSSATGYGRKIPTRYQLKYENRWHRVYMMVYGNAGTAYILSRGDELVLETETEHRIDRHRDGAGPDVAINTLKPGDRFRFHHDGVVCTLLDAHESGRYTWSDYSTGGRLWAPHYAGTGKVAWPYVYPTDDPETVVTTKNGEVCAEFEENGSCIHSDHTA